MRTLIISILLCACETWTLTIELQRRIKAVEMRCYRCLLHISYKVHITNEIVCKKIQAAIGDLKNGRCYSILGNVNVYTQGLETLA